MSSMLDYHTPHLSLPARGHGEGGDQVFTAFCGVSCGPVRIAQGDALCLAGLWLASRCGQASSAFCVDAIHWNVSPFSSVVCCDP
jgi:hypothetical protein